MGRGFLRQHGLTDIERLTLKLATGACAIGSDVVADFCELGQKNNKADGQVRPQRLHNSMLT